MATLDNRGRPRLPLGTWGEINVRNIGPSRYLARAQYRRADGNTVRIARVGQTKGDARTRLLAALADQQGTGGEIGQRSTVGELVERWLTEIEDSQRRPQTVDAYRTPARNIQRRIGELRAAELTAGRCDTLLRSVKAEQGPGAARNVRKVLNGICKLAVRHGILPSNPVRDTETIEAPRKRVRALSAEQVEELSDRLRTDPQAVSQDIPDLVEMALATGCRIGELLAVRWEAFNDDGEPVLDLNLGTVEINATIVRIRTRGLVLQPRPKTAAGWRVLKLPPHAVEMLKQRRGLDHYRTDEGVVFTNPHKPRLRDPARVAEDLRNILPRLGYGWVTSHVWRKTVATRLDEAGLSARVIADHLGHERPSMTMDTYMGRRVVSAAAAEALER